MGYWCLRACRIESFRSPAQQALSDAAAAGEIFGGAPRARRPQTGFASFPCADGDSLEAVSWPAGLRELRVLYRVWVRGHGQVVGAVYDDSGGRSDGSVRSALAELRLSR